MTAVNLSKDCKKQRPESKYLMQVELSTPDFGWNRPSPPGSGAEAQVVDFVGANVSKLERKCGRKLRKYVLTSLEKDHTLTRRKLRRRLG
jgi:hypothetical protein